MKRSGFTMIELIFVIVILGILAAVALPKFIGVSEQANVGKLKAFVGTMNRSAGPSMWSATMTDPGISQANKGKIATMTLSDYVDIPEGMTLSIAACAAAGTAAFPAATDAQMGTFTIGTTTYNLGCMEGSNAESPRFSLSDGTTVLVGQ